MTRALLLLLFLASCASVGPVEVTEDDTIFTVASAVFAALAFWYCKNWIEYRFAVKLEKKKKELETTSKDD